MVRSYRNCVVWRKAVEFRNYIYELTGRLKIKDSHIFIDMRNTVDILVFGIMMAYEYMDEDSVLECLSNSRGKAARLDSMFNRVVLGNYLIDMEIEEIHMLISGIILAIDILIKQVESGEFFKDEPDVFDELDELD